MEKRDVRAQSSIIAIVLIILLIIAAVIILWNVVYSTTKKSSEQSNIDQFTFRGDLKYSLSSQKDNVTVNVNRGPGGGNIIGIKLIFEFSDGTSRSYENKTDYPKELEAKNYLITGNNLDPTFLPSNFSSLKKISVHYIFLQNNKETPSIQIASSEISIPTSECTSESQAVTCGSWVCGNKTNNCGIIVTCGTCAQTCCSGNCVNIQTNSSNCGSCGNACSPGQPCSSGFCVCNYGPWVNQKCGMTVGSVDCIIGQMYQNRSIITGTGCTNTAQCNSTVDTCNLISSAVSYWKFNGNMNDSIGNSHGSCTGSNCPTLTTDNKGYANSAYNFNSNLSQYINTGNKFNITGQSTLSLWFNSNSFTGSKCLFSKGWQSNTAGFYVLYLTANNNILFQYSNGTVWKNLNFNKHKFNLNQWYHLVFVRNNVTKNLSLYINGVFNMSNTYYPDNALNINSGNTLLGIYQTLNIYPFNGSLDEIMFFNRNLSASEIQKIYNYQN